MLGSNSEKEISKADMKKKVEAYKTINSVLVQANSNFMSALTNMLTEKEVQHSQLKEKIEGGNATEEENALYIFTGGYIQCLKDILYAKRAESK